MIHAFTTLGPKVNAELRQLILSGKRVANVFTRSPNARENIVEGSDEAQLTWMEIAAPLHLFDVALRREDPATFDEIRRRWAHSPHDAARLKSVRSWFRDVGASKAMRTAPVLAFLSSYVQVPGGPEKLGLYIHDGWHRTAAWDELHPDRPIPTLVGVEAATLRRWRRAA